MINRPAAESGSRPRTGSAPGQISSCNFLMVPESFRNGVEHISHLVDPNPCCHFCKEPCMKPIHEGCTRLTIVSGGNIPEPSTCKNVKTRFKCKPSCLYASCIVGRKCVCSQPKRWLVIHHATIVNWKVNFCHAGMSCG